MAIIGDEGGGYVPVPDLTPVEDPLKWQADWVAFQQSKAERQNAEAAQGFAPGESVRVPAARASFVPVGIGDIKPAPSPLDVGGVGLRDPYQTPERRDDEEYQARQRQRKQQEDLASQDAINLRAENYKRLYQDKYGEAISKGATEDQARRYANDTTGVQSGTGVNVPGSSRLPAMNASAPVPYQSPGFDTKLPYIRPGEAWFQGDWRGGQGWLANPYTPGTEQWRLRQIEVDRRKGGGGSSGGGGGFGSGGGGGTTPTGGGGGGGNTSAWNPRQYQPDAEGFLRVDDNIYAQLPRDAREDFIGLLAGLGFRGTGVMGSGGATEYKGQPRRIELTQEQVDRFTNPLTKPFIDRLLGQIGWLAQPQGATVKVPSNAPVRII